MDSSHSEVYQDIILDNNRNPTNKRKMDYSNGSSKGYNPLCGDEVTEFVWQRLCNFAGKRVINGNIIERQNHR